MTNDPELRTIGDDVRSQPSGSHSSGRLKSLTRVDLTLIAGLVCAAWILYRPLNVRPFDYIDFPENIVLLQSGHSITDRFTIVLHSYEQHGRWNPVAIALLAVQWSLFGWWTPGWQLFRYVVMAMTTVFGYSLYRKLDLLPIGSFAAATLLVTSPAASQGWLRLSTAEPVGVLLVVAACHYALRSYGDKEARRASWTVAVLLLLATWEKEMIAAAFVLPAILLLAVRTDGTLGRPRRGRIAFLVPSLIAIVAAGFPILLTLANSPANSFASAYGSVRPSAVSVIGSVLVSLLPFTPVSAEGGSRFGVVLVFVGLLVLGWRSLFQPSTRTVHLRQLLLLGLVTPLVGALAYSLWPFYVFVYALPFVVGGALVLGGAVTSLTMSRPSWRLIGTIAFAVVVWTSFATAFNETQRTLATQAVVAETVTRISAMPNVDSVLVAVADDQFAASGTFSPRLSLYARALRIPWPAVRDVRCATDSTPSPALRTVALWFSVMCSPPKNGIPLLSAPYRRISWSKPFLLQDSVRVYTSASASPADVVP